ncbi:hypothetical protein OC835_001916 [Tilletia horrida]|nr:hypothetical protein OC835_001916 [Tilletia horrida]
MARGRNNKLRKGERAAAKMGMPVSPLDKLPTPAASTRSRLTATIEEKKQLQQVTAHASPSSASASASGLPAVASASSSKLAAGSAAGASSGRGKDYAGRGRRLNSYLADIWGKNEDGYGDDKYYYGDEDDNHYYDEEDELEDDDAYYEEDELDDDDDDWADEDEDVPGPRSTAHQYGWGRRDKEAASKSKLSKPLPPSSLKPKSASTKKGSPPDPLDDEDLCDHTSLIASRMRTVNSLLTDIFTASFKMALPSLYRGMVYNLQEEIMRDKLMAMIDNGVSPKSIRTMASDPLYRQGIHSQLKHACEDELADVVLRLSTEDAFDLLCDLAMRHGRNLRLWGPPCACSFSHCLPCLERLVNTVRTTPPPKDYSLYSNPTMDSTSRLAIAAATAKANEQDKAKSAGNKGKGKKGVKPPQKGSTALTKPGAAASSSAPAAPRPRSKLARIDLMDWVAGLIEADWVDKRRDWSDPDAWEADVWAAWQTLNDVVWEVADEIEPLSLERVSVFLAGLGKMNGLDLYYAVVTRELTYNPTATRKKPAHAPSWLETEDKPKTPPAKVVAEAISWEGIYDRMKKETRELRRKQRAEQRGKARADGPDAGVKIAAQMRGDAIYVTYSADADADAEDEDDVEGSDYRRALARAVREQGNSAYASGSYFDAVDHYTRAIGYDMTEPIYPLNRAACLLKLRLFEDAEKDCTAAIRLDPDNHKAYFRRGASRAGMGKISLARQDFDKVLELHVGTPEACDELRKLADRLIAEAPSRLTSGDAGKKATAGAAAAAPSTTSAAQRDLPALSGGLAMKVTAQVVENMLDEQAAWLKADLKRQAREDTKERARKRRLKMELEAALAAPDPPPPAAGEETEELKAMRVQWGEDRRMAATALLQSLDGEGSLEELLTTAMLSCVNAPGAAGTASDSDRSRHPRDDDADDSDVVAPSSATSDMPQGGGVNANLDASGGDGKRSRSVTSNGSAMDAKQAMAAVALRQAELDEIQRQVSEMREALSGPYAPQDPQQRLQELAAIQQRQDTAAAAAAAAAAATADGYDAEDEEDEGVRALLTNPSETVACWTTFAFVFSLIVAQKTGINVPERLGFVRQYNPAGAAAKAGAAAGGLVGACGTQAAVAPITSAEFRAAATQEEEEEEDSLLAELRRAAEAKKLGGTGGAANANSTPSTATTAAPATKTSTSMSDTLELLRSVPLEDHLDRIVNFLRQPEVQPVLAV